MAFNPSHSDDSTSPPTPATQRCLITKLPDEILVQILRYLTPTGESYHVFPTCRAWHNEGDLVTAIHRFRHVELDEHGKIDPSYFDTLRRRTAMASVCRRLQDLYYSSFYGDNKFIFEIQMMDWIGTVTSSANDPILSWTKYCDVAPTSIWPFHKRSAPYVKDLTILIGFHDPGDYHEFACQQAHLESFVDSLTTRHSLTKLAIDVRARSPRPKSYKVPFWHFEVPRLGRGAHSLHFELSPTSIEGWRTSEKGLSDAFWERLPQGLRGLRTVEITGPLKPTHADENVATMTHRPADTNPDAASDTRESGENTREATFSPKRRRVG